MRLHELRSWNSLAYDAVMCQAIKAFVMNQPYMHRKMLTIERAINRSSKYTTFSSPIEEDISDNLRRYTKQRGNSFTVVAHNQGQRLVFNSRNTAASYFNCTPEYLDKVYRKKMTISGMLIDIKR